MASKVVTFETGHEEMIHDAQLDYYGKKLATASSDRSIRIFEIAGEHQVPLATISGHDGPVWSVAWAHPKFGTLLASGSYDQRVCIWKEEQNGTYSKVFEDQSHEASVNAVAWAPHSFGLCLGAASSDGTVSIITYKDASKQWERKVIPAHKGGVNAISWGPDLKTGALLAMGANQPQQSMRVSRRFVTAGCDNRVRIWRLNEADGNWAEQKMEVGGGHSDWVRDVAWAQSVGLASNTIASASEDKSVIIWTEDAQGQWKKAATLPFQHKVWRVSWSQMGNILAVSQGDNKVSLWKEGLDGKWTNLSEMKENEKEKDEKKEQ